MRKRIIKKENESSTDKKTFKKYVCIAPETDGRVINLAIERKSERICFQDLTNQNLNEKGNRMSEATKDEEKPNKKFPPPAELA